MISREEWARRAARPIPVPEELVENIASEMEAFVSEVSSGEINAPRDGVLYKVLDAGLQGVRGEHHWFTVGVEFDSSWGDVVESGYISRDKKYLGVVFQRLSGGKFKRYYGSKEKSRLRSIIRHELIHMRDHFKPGDAVSLSDVGDRSKYFNSRAEIRAYMQTVCDEVSEILEPYLENEWELKPETSSQASNLIRRMLDRSRTYVTISNHLEPESYKKFYTGLVNCLVEKHPDVFEPLTRRGKY